MTKTFKEFVVENYQPNNKLEFFVYGRGFNSRQRYEKLAVISKAIIDKNDDMVYYREDKTLTIGTDGIDDLIPLLFKRTSYILDSDDFYDSYKATEYVICVEPRDLENTIGTGGYCVAYFSNNMSIYDVQKGEWVEDGAKKLFKQKIERMI